jgi:hypothetical protein
MIDGVGGAGIVEGIVDKITLGGDGVGGTNGEGLKLINPLYVLTEITPVGIGTIEVVGTDGGKAVAGTITTVVDGIVTTVTDGGTSDDLTITGLEIVFKTDTGGIVTWLIMFEGTATEGVAT